MRIKLALWLDLDIFAGSSTDEQYKLIQKFVLENRKNFDFVIDDCPDNEELVDEVVP